MCKGQNTCVSGGKHTVPFQKRADVVILGNTVESEETGHFLSPGLAFAIASQSS